MERRGFVVIAACVLCAAGAAGPGTPTAVDQARRIFDRSGDAAEQSEALRAFEAMSGETRSRAVVELARGASEPLRSEALVYLAGMREVSAEAADHLVAETPVSAEPTQRAVLAVLRGQRSPLGAQVAREVLASVRTRNPGAGGPTDLQVIDIASVLLAKEANAADAALIIELLSSHPGSRGLWLARARFGTIGAEERALAARTWTDPEQAMPTRVAAAIAASSVDEAASQFVRATVSSGLERFGPMTLQELVTEAWKNGQDSEEWNRLREFRDEFLKVLGMVEYFGDDAAADLLRDAITSQNEAIRQNAALVAAIRAPELLLTTDRNMFRDEEHARLLAVLVEAHPELEGRAAPLVDEANLDRAKQRLRDRGFAGLALQYGSLDGL